MQHLPDYAYVIHGELNSVPTYAQVRSDLEELIHNLNERITTLRESQRAGAGPTIQLLTFQLEEYRRALTEYVYGTNSINSYVSHMQHRCQSRIRAMERRAEAMPHYAGSGRGRERLQKSLDYFSDLLNVLNAEVQARELSWPEGADRELNRDRDTRAKNIVNVARVRSFLEEYVYKTATAEFGWDLDDGEDQLRFARTLKWVMTRGEQYVMEEGYTAPVVPVNVVSVTRADGTREVTERPAWAARISGYSNRDRSDYAVSSGWHKTDPGPSQRNFLLVETQSWFEARWFAGVNLQYMFNIESLCDDQLRAIIVWMLDPANEAPGDVNTVTRLDFAAASHLREEAAKEAQKIALQAKLDACPKLVEFHEPERGLWTLHHVSHTELAAEATFMDNCIAGYDSEVRRGSVVFLSARLDGVPKITARLDRVEDVTPEVRMVDGKLIQIVGGVSGWELEDVRGVGNMNSKKWIPGVKGLAAALGIPIDERYIKLKEDHEEDDDETAVAEADGEEAPVVEADPDGEDDAEDDYGDEADDEDEDGDEDEEEEDDEPAPPRRPIRRPVPAERRA